MTVVPGNGLEHQRRILHAPQKDPVVRPSSQNHPWRLHASIGRQVRRCHSTTLVQR